MVGWYLYVSLKFTCNCDIDLAVLVRSNENASYNCLMKIIKYSISFALHVVKFLSIDICFINF